MSIYSVYVAMKPVQNVTASSPANAIRLVKKKLGSVKILSVRVN